MLAAVLAGAVMTSGQPALIHADAAISPGGSGGIVLQLGELAVKVNGEDRKLEAAPMLSGDTTLVPLRFIAEALGAAVTWEEATRTAVLETGGATVRLTVDAAAAIVNGQPKELAAAPLISGETLMVPLRIIGESFGREVGYDGVTKRISISAPSVQSEAMPEGGAATPSTGPEAAKETTTKTGEATGLKQLKHPQVMTFRGVLGMSANVYQTPSSRYIGSMWGPTYKETLGMVVDKNNNVYLLHKDTSFGPIGNGGYVIDKIDPTFSERVQENRVFGEQFAFEYTQSDIKRKYSSNNFLPEKLIYNDKTDKVYVYGKNTDPDYKFGAMLYEVFPKVSLTASLTVSANSPLGGNFVTFGDDQTIYISDIGGGEIFEIKPGGMPQRYSFIKDGTPTERRLHAIYNKGLIVFDSSDSKLRKYSSAGGEVLQTIEAKEVLGMTDYKGKLYIASDNKVSEISADGTISEWLNMQDINFMEGLYNQETKSMDPSPPNLAEAGPNSLVNYSSSSDEKDSKQVGWTASYGLYAIYPTKALKLHLFGFNREGQLWAFDRETHYIRSIQEQ